VRTGALEDALDAVEVQAPEEGLRAVALIRSRLDALEARHVERALGAGWSWAQVGELLGVTKQAVHKKHARRVAQASPDAGENGAKRKLLVTADAQRTVRCAREEAAALGAGALGPEHLVLGLLRGDDGPVPGALQAAGVALERAREEAAATGGGKGRPAAEPGDGPLPVEPAAREAMEQSLREAVARGDGHLGVEHLLLALVRERKGRGARLLVRVGADPAEVERLLAERLAAAQ
jgi:ClpA/ClpB-like protein